MSNVTKLITPVDNNMSIEQVKKVVQAEPWESMIVLGYHKDYEDFVVRSSQMSRKDALWLCEMLKRHVLGEGLEDG